MDPNETLRQLRVWAKYTDSEAADLFEALDEWIMNHGSLPQEWLHAQLMVNNFGSVKETER